MEGNIYVGGSGSMPIVNVPLGASVKFDDDTNVTPQIFFGGYLSHEDVFEILGIFHQSVVDVITNIEKSVAASSSNHKNIPSGTSSI